jgi:hypothetical protein
MKEQTHSRSSNVDNGEKDKMVITEVIRSEDATLMEPFHINEGMPIIDLNGNNANLEKQEQDNDTPTKRISGSIDPTGMMKSDFRESEKPDDLKFSA